MFAHVTSQQMVPSQPVYYYRNPTCCQWEHDPVYSSPFLLHSINGFCGYFAGTIGLQANGNMIVWQGQLVSVQNAWIRRGGRGWAVKGWVLFHIWGKGGRRKFTTTFTHPPMDPITIPSQLKCYGLYALACVPSSLKQSALFPLGHNHLKACLRTPYRSHKMRSHPRYRSTPPPIVLEEITDYTIVGPGPRGISRSPCRTQGVLRLI